MTHDCLMPLSGIRVLDLGRFVAAPWAGQMLGDLGAEVIKVERPGTGDDIRSYGPPFVQTSDGKQDLSFDYLAVNRNKKSVTVNLADAEGQNIIRRLAASSDVLIENFRVGHLARRGLGYADIARLNPGIIYCSISGFGQTGPYAPRPGLDSIFQAMSGLMSVTGEPTQEPTKVGTMICDVTAGTYAVVAILAALRHREVNQGSGQHIDLALLDTAIAALSSRAQSYLSSGVSPVRTGAETPGNQPSGTYSSADGTIILSAGADAQFRLLAKALGRDDLVNDERYRTRQLRVENKASLTEALNAEFGNYKRADLLATLSDAGVMAAPIYTIEQAFDDQQVRHRGVRTTAKHRRAGKLALVANPIKFSATRIDAPASPPDLGEDTDDVLRSIIGASPDELSRWRAGGTI